MIFMGKLHPFSLGRGYVSALLPQNYLLSSPKYLTDLVSINILGNLFTSTQIYILTYCVNIFHSIINSLFMFNIFSEIGRLDCIDNFIFNPISAQHILFISAELFQLFAPLITEDCIQFANGGEGRKRHAAYARNFSDEAMVKYYPDIQQVCIM